MHDRIDFAKKFMNSDNHRYNFAKELCIVEYFDKLMALYDLVATNYPNEQEGIQSYWFEDDKKFIMKIKFSTIDKLTKFCNELDINNGTIFIYGLTYDLIYVKEQDNICSIELICSGCPAPYDN